MDVHNMSDLGAPGKRHRGRRRQDARAVGSPGRQRTRRLGSGARPGAGGIGFADLQPWGMIVATGPEHEVARPVP